MIRSELLLAYTATSVVAALMPGPAVLSVASIGLTGSFRGMAGAITGVNAANLLWYCMVGAGLIVLVHTFPHLFDILGWAGTAYLFWLGVKTWNQPVDLSLKGSSKAMSYKRGFAGAVALQLSNPKAMVFFTVFLPPFIDTRMAVPPQLAILAAIGVLCESIALSGYGLLAWRVGRLAMSPTGKERFARISGSILMAISIAMAIARMQ